MAEKQETEILVAVYLYSIWDLNLCSPQDRRTEDEEQDEEQEDDEEEEEDEEDDELSEDDELLDPVHHVLDSARTTNSSRCPTCVYFCWNSFRT